MKKLRHSKIFYHKIPITKRHRGYIVFKVVSICITVLNVLIHRPQCPDQAILFRWYPTWPYKEKLDGACKCMCLDHRGEIDKRQRQNGPALIGINYSCNDLYPIAPKAPFYHVLHPFFANMKIWKASCSTILVPTGACVWHPRVYMPWEEAWC